MATIYVSKDGDDISGTGSGGNPYLTITKAVSEAGANDKIIIGAGTYVESNIDPGNVSGVKIRNDGDGQVIIDGSAGSGSLLGNTILPYNGWVIDGSTGSNLQNIEIIGGTESCVRGEGGTGRSFSLKHIILTGKFSSRPDLSDEDNSTKYAIKFPSTSTIRNVVVRNFTNGAVTYVGTPGPIYFYNNLVYRIGTAANSEPIIHHEDGDNEIFFNTIVGCTGSSGIDTVTGPSPTIKNNLLAENRFAASGISFRGTTNILNNCVYSSFYSPSNGAYDDTLGGSVDSSNLEVDPLLKGTNPWDEIFDNNVNGDFSVIPSVSDYNESPRTTAGSPIEGAGEYLGANFSTDFSGSARPRPPGIGALRVVPTLLFSKAPTGTGLANKVLGDFTINHFNRISKETPRNVDQIPFGRAVVGPSNLKDRTTAYKLEKGKEGS